MWVCIFLQSINNITAQRALYIKLDIYPTLHTHTYSIIMYIYIYILYILHIYTHTYYIYEISTTWLFISLWIINYFVAQIILSHRYKVGYISNFTHIHTVNSCKIIHTIQQIVIVYIFPKCILYYCTALYIVYKYPTVYKRTDCTGILCIIIFYSTVLIHFK